MKKIVFIHLFLLCIAYKTEAQTSVVYAYDAAGNMIQRQITVLLTSPTPPPGGSGSKLIQPKDSSSEVSPPLSFKIYPNPAQTQVTVEGELPKNCAEANIQLLNNTGQILKTITYNGQTKAIDVSDLKNGLYAIEIIYNKKQKTTYQIIVTN